MARTCKEILPKNIRDNHTFYGLELDPYQQKFQEALWNEDYRIVFCDAVAGTGKTTISAGMANLLYLNNKYDYNGIVYIVSPYGEKRQGYLPGDMTQKSEVYFEPFYQALYTIGLNPFVVINNDPQMSEKTKNGEAYIKCFTHTFTRGTNLEKKIAIIDESQNFSLDDLRKLLTRFHDSCKVIVIGHAGQVDLPDKFKSGFKRYYDHFNGQPYSAHCELKINHRGKISTHADEII